MMTRPVLSTAVLSFSLGVTVTLLAGSLKDDVIAAEEAWAKARAAGDKTAYARLLADEFTWTYTNGTTVDKRRSVDALRPFPSPVKGREIRTYDSAAVVSGAASLVVAGEPANERFVRVWAKRDGRWQAVLFQATKTPQ